MSLSPSTPLFTSLNFIFVLLPRFHYCLYLVIFSAPSRLVPFPSPFSWYKFFFTRLYFLSRIFFFFVLSFSPVLTIHSPFLPVSFVLIPPFLPSLIPSLISHNLPFLSSYVKPSVVLSVPYYVPSFLPPFLPRLPQWNPVKRPALLPYVTKRQHHYEGEQQQHQHSRHQRRHNC